MRRHGWVLSVGAMLCGGLLPACTNTSGPNLSPGPVLRPPVVEPDGTRSEAFSSDPAAPEASKPAQAVVKTEPVSPPPQPAPVPKRAIESVSLPAPRLEGPPVQVDLVQTASLTAAASRSAEDPPVVAALRCLLEKRPQEALGRLEHYDKPNQEVLLALLPLVVRLSEGSLAQADPTDIAVVLDELDSLVQPMRTRASLTITAMCFCKRIETFGVYDPLPTEYSFRPNDMVQIYVELKNFTSRKRKNPSGETRYVVELGTTAEIRDAAGNKVFNQFTFERARPDECRTPRSDYFDNYRFCVPDLAPGSYTLSIQVEDRGSTPPRKATRSLDFRVTNLPARGA